MVLICNQPEEAEKVLEQLRFTPSKVSRQRLKQMRPRGKALQLEQAAGAAWTTSRRRRC